MINKLMTAFDNYMVGYRERGEQIKASNENALLKHRLKRGMASELSKRLDVNTNMGVSRNNDYAPHSSEMNARQQDSLRRDEFRRSYNNEYQRRLNKLRETK